MCTNIKKIFNKYTHQVIYSKCGNCPSCLQEKAAKRVSRIKFQDSDDLDVLFVSLTYRRNDVPYIRREDAYKFSYGEYVHLKGETLFHRNLRVYRDCIYRKVRQSSSYDIGYKRTYVTQILQEVPFDKKVSFTGCKDLKHKHGCIGVVYYPDLQHFLARLRLNLKRNFNYYGEFKTYNCSEFGSHTHRPHFHLLFWIPKGSAEIFRSAIFESWPYGDISRWQFDRYSQKFIQPCVQDARCAATYVASYVNCGSDFPQFLKVYFKPKHSFSKGFGCNYPLFQLDSILEKFSRGHLTYFKRNVESGKLSELPFPKYIIHRYFPKFKGYGLLPSYALSEVMQRVRECYFGEGSQDSFRLVCPDLFETCPVFDLDYVRRIFEFHANAKGVPIQFFSDEDLYKMSVRINNAYLRFLLLGPFISFADYCKLHYSVWSLYASDLLRISMIDSSVPLQERYYNLDDLKYDCEQLGKPLPCGFLHSMLSVTDPNKFVSVQLSSRKWSDDYYDHLKHRKINNVVLSQQDSEV